MELGDRKRDSCLAVEGENVFFKYQNQTILDGLDISVEKGIIYGLLGPSGCGKTTLLRCIVGRLKPNSGTIKIYGKKPGHKELCIPGPGVGFMPQELALYPEITIEETLIYFGRLYQMSEKCIKERISFLEEFLDLPDKKKRIRQLSGGQQRRVSFAAAIIHKPPLVILDEPTVGVDPLLRKNIWNYLKKWTTEDFVTILITTHYVEEARQANAVGFMRDGRLLVEANPEQLLTQFNALTLEDVFLKLCTKDMLAKKVHEDDQEFGGEDEERNFKSENYENIWIKLQSKTQPYAPPIYKNVAGREASLLHNATDPEFVFNPEMKDRSGIGESSLRLAALITKNFTRLRRNIPFFFFQVFIPTFQIILFCLSVGQEPFDIPLSIVNMEEDPLGKSDYFLEHINSKIIKQIPFSNLTAAIESVKIGKSYGVLQIKPGFTGSLIDRIYEGREVSNETIEASTVTLNLDMTNHQILLTLLTNLVEGFQFFSKRVLEQYHLNPRLAELPIKVGSPIYGHEKTNFTEFMAPGMILGATYFMAVGLSSMSIIIEKKAGLLDRSLIAGVRAWEVLFSLLLPLFLIMTFQIAFVLFCTFVIFNIPCLGSFVWVFIATLLAGIEGMSYGIFISSLVNDENMAIMITFGSFYPNILLSGIIWPVEAMPYYLRYIGYWMPLTLLTNTVRCVLSRGWSIKDYGIWNGYLMAVAWSIPVIIISSIIFKYKK